MNSLQPKEYASLPKLVAPAGYICVLRDIDRDVYRIDGTDHPTTYIDALLADKTGSYGIELISILKADDLVASESQLYDAHHARLSDEWLDLDDHQLAELRRSDLKIYAHRSLYLRPRCESTAKIAASERSATRDSRSASSISRRSAGRARPRISRSSPAYRTVQADTRQSRVRLDDIDDLYALLRYMGERLQPLREITYRLKELVLDYMLLWLFVAFVLAFVLLAFMLKYGAQISLRFGGL